MAITKKEVDHLALLARLGLSEKEKAKLAPDLAKILDYVGQLQKAPTENVEPMTGGTSLFNIGRQDQKKEPGILEPGPKLLGQVPQVEGSAVKVPRILE